MTYNIGKGEYGKRNARRGLRKRKDVSFLLHIMSKVESALGKVGIGLAFLYFYYMHNNGA